MFGFSFGELVVIAVVGLLVLGPEDLPKVLRTMSKAWRSLQLMMRDIRHQLDDVIRQEELAELKQLREAIKGKTGFIIDEQGRYQPTYDIADLMEKRTVKSPSVPPESPPLVDAEGHALEKPHDPA